MSIKTNYPEIDEETRLARVAESAESITARMLGRYDCGCQLGAHIEGRCPWETKEEKELRRRKVKRNGE